MLFLLATFQLLVATGHIITWLLLLIQGFVTHIGDPGGPNAYFARESNPIYTAQVVLWTTNASDKSTFTIFL
jgi:hypothetical protein